MRCTWEQSSKWRLLRNSVKNRELRKSRFLKVSGTMFVRGFLRCFFPSLGRHKAKVLQPVERISPVPFRKPNRPKPPPPSCSKSTITKAGLLQAYTQPKPSTTSDSKPKPSSRSTHSLKDRVIHMLALKPHTREHIVNKLKKGNYFPTMCRIFYWAINCSN